MIMMMTMHISHSIILLHDPNYTCDRISYKIPITMTSDSPSTGEAPGMEAFPSSRIARLRSSCLRGYHLTTYNLDMLSSCHVTALCKLGITHEMW